VVEAGLVIGREVKQGEILVELDSASERLQIAEERSRQAALGAQIEALREQIAAEDRAKEQERTAAQSGREQNQADAREAETALAHAESAERRFPQLSSEGLASAREYQQARSEARRLRAVADSRGIAVERGGQDQLTRASDRAARIQGLQSQIATLEAEIPTIDAAIERLQHEIGRRSVRAPVDGRLGEAAVIRPGAVLKEGDRLGAIVPSGRLRAVAEFPAEDAMGRIRPGQPARLRLDGFPWIEYGTVTARVARVAGEVRDGAVRVEFSLNPASGSRIPLQHGLPGSVEVEVERSTPLALVLRHAGRQWAAPRGGKNQAAGRPAEGGF